MSLPPPPGSRIVVAREGVNEVVRVPPPDKGPLPYFIAAFLICWLIGWAFALESAASELIRSGGKNHFLILWLILWSLGGLLGLFFVYRLLRAAVPESFNLRADGVLYDPGAAPFRVFTGPAARNDMWKWMFERRRVRELTSADLKTLTLRETANGNRLTVDKDNERIDLAISSSEIEREWLYAFLSKRYS